jgi:hypothetical protein
MVESCALCDVRNELTTYTTYINIFLDDLSGFCIAVILTLEVPTVATVQNYVFR